MHSARLHSGSIAGERDPDVREDERRKLARDLHDGPAQAMAAALFGVDLATRACEWSPSEVREELLRARELLREALDDLRGIMAGLRPRTLDERGLAAALEALVGMTPLWGPVVTVETAAIAREERLPAPVELALYRIAQEAVSNARRHSGAARVIVQLRRRRNSVRLDVLDDGQGFPPMPMRIGPSDDRGQGLPGMQERAAAIGGTLTIESAPGAGTRIVATIPLSGRRSESREDGR